VAGGAGLAEVGVGELWMVKSGSIRPEGPEVYQYAASCHSARLRRSSPKQSPAQ